MDGLQCSRLKVATATKVVVAGERPDPGASSHHRIIGTMQAHFRSCTVPENNWCSGFRWVLAVRAAQIHEAFCVFDLGSHRGARQDCLRNSCARALGILSIVIVVFIMEKEIRFFWWLFLFHLRPIEECDVEVLVAPSFLCDARAFHLCASMQNP